MNIFIKLPLLLIYPLLIMGCFSQFHYDPQVDQNDTHETQIFPEDFILTSPTSIGYYSTLAPDDAMTNPNVTAANEAAILAEITRLFEAETIEDCTSELSIPQKMDDASPLCFGPNLEYENHFDQDGFNSGQLPSGDLGIWLENEPNTNEACAARVLNSRLATINAKINFTRQSLASLICVLHNTKDLTLPQNGDILDLTTDLNLSIGSELVTVSSATLAVADVDNQSEFTYSLQMEIKTDVDSIENQVNIDMRHKLLNDEGSDYDSELLYQFNQNNDSGNCPGNNTIAGSLFFEKISNEQNFRSDSSEYCKINDAPFTNGSLDPTYTYDGLHVGGWGNSYNIFIGNFNRESQTGSFSYLWQAGANDGYSRIFNLSISKNLNTIVADAYFGYGGDLTLGNADSTIWGFICDWATPNSTKIVQAAVQYQAMHLDGTEFVSDGVNISYAPTHTCDYNPADEIDGAFFNYDINSDQVLDSADQDLVDLGITNDLLPLDAMDFIPPDDILSSQ